MDCRVKPGNDGLMHLMSLPGVASERSIPEAAVRSEAGSRGEIGLAALSRELLARDDAPRARPYLRSSNTTSASASSAATPCQNRSG